MTPKNRFYLELSMDVERKLGSKLAHSLWETVLNRTVFTSSNNKLFRAILERALENECDYET